MDSHDEAPIENGRRYLPRQVMTAEDLVERARKLPRIDYEEMRRDIEEFFGSDRLGEADDPWERARG